MNQKDDFHPWVNVLHYKLLECGFRIKLTRKSMENDIHYVLISKGNFFVVQHLRCHCTLLESEFSHSCQIHQHYACIYACKIQRYAEAAQILCLKCASAEQVINAGIWTGQTSVAIVRYFRHCIVPANSSIFIVRRHGCKFSVAHFAKLRPELSQVWHNDYVRIEVD